MKIICIIPARYQSSRFPGKPLAHILNKPMIYWVYNAIVKIHEISNIYVATDDKRIFEAVKDFGGQPIITGDCSCGTERVYEACKHLDFDIVLNIQGDEPMIKREIILDLIGAFQDKTVQVATLKKRITSEKELYDPNIAKVVTNKQNDAIYFSRSLIPFNRDKRDDITFYKHIGVYGYTKSFIEKYVSLPQTILEKAEELEQLRVIEHGYKIRVIETLHQSIGVDLPEHIAIVEKYMRGEL